MYELIGYSPDSDRLYAKINGNYMMTIVDSFGRGNEALAGFYFIFERTIDTVIVAEQVSPDWRGINKGFPEAYSVIRYLLDLRASHSNLSKVRHARCAFLNKMEPWYLRCAKALNMRWTYVTL